MLCEFIIGNWNATLLAYVRFLERHTHLSLKQWGLLQLTTLPSLCLLSLVYLRGCEKTRVVLVSQWANRVSATLLILMLICFLLFMLNPT